MRQFAGFRLAHLLSVAILTTASAADAQQLSAAGKSGDAQRINALEEGYVFNIIDWDGGEVPRLYERSDQLPLTLADVRKLSANEFAVEDIVKMIEERRCACDASVDALVELKGAGVAPEVIKAVSLHALGPNRRLGLRIIIDFEGLGGAEEVGGAPEVSSSARRGYLYLIVPDGDRERVFLGSLQTILGKKWQRDGLVDNTDLLLPKKVRRIVFESEVPLKTQGAKRAMVFTSTKPDIYTSGDIPAQDREGVQYFEFEYPKSSLQQSCVLQVLYRQDALLADKWQLVRTHFECEWD